MLGGALAHQDSSGGGGVIRPGRAAVDERRPWRGTQRVQRLRHRAGAFPADMVQPDRLNAAPAYAQREATPSRSPAAGRCSPRPMAATAASRSASRRGCMRAQLAAGERRRGRARSRAPLLAAGDAGVGGRCGDRTLVAGDALGFVDEDGSAGTAWRRRGSGRPAVRSAGLTRGDAGHRARWRSGGQRAAAKLTASRRRRAAAACRHDRRQRPPHPGQRPAALHRLARRPAAELPAAVDGAVELAPARVPADRSRGRMPVPVLRRALRPRR